MRDCWRGTLGKRGRSKREGFVVVVLCFSRELVDFFFFFRTMAKEARSFTFAFIYIHSKRSVYIRMTKPPQNHSNSSAKKPSILKFGPMDMWPSGPILLICCKYPFPSHPSISFPRPSLSLCPPKRCRSKFPPSALPSVLHTLSQQS